MHHQINIAKNGWRGHQKGQLKIHCLSYLGLFWKNRPSWENGQAPLSSKTSLCHITIYKSGVVRVDIHVNVHENFTNHQEAESRGYDKTDAKVWQFVCLVGLKQSVSCSAAFYAGLYGYCILCRLSCILRTWKCQCFFKVFWLNLSF